MGIKGWTEFVRWREIMETWWKVKGWLKHLKVTNKSFYSENRQLRLRILANETRISFFSQDFRCIFIRTGEYGKCEWWSVAKSLNAKLKKKIICRKLNLWESFPAKSNLAKNKQYQWGCCKDMLGSNGYPIWNTILPF